MGRLDQAPSGTTWQRSNVSSGSELSQEEPGELKGEWCDRRCRRRGETGVCTHALQTSYSSCTAQSDQISAVYAATARLIKVARAESRFSQWRARPEAQGRRSRSSNKEQTKERPITLTAATRRLHGGDSFLSPYCRLQAHYPRWAKFTRPRSSTPQPMLLIQQQQQRACFNPPIVIPCATTATARQSMTQIANIMPATLPIS